jgi:hypothetical protein
LEESLLKIENGSGSDSASGSEDDLEGTKKTHKSKKSKKSHKSKKSGKTDKTKKSHTE